NQQVGYGNDINNNPHALLWLGSANTAVDLHPTGLPNEFSNSAAYGTSGSQQVGGGHVFFGDVHALLWSGSANSAVDLNPTNIGINGSDAYATNGTQQVGDGQGASTGG